MNVQSLISFLENKIPDGLKSSFLLAVSGGVDSMVLLDLFLKSQLHFSVAHCNFQLRGKDSDLDEKLIKDYCTKNNIPVYIKRFDIKNMETEKPKSTQMLARELRYHWFKELQKELFYDYLVVAHHATDQIETVLLNLVRGTGISGLRGMKAVSRDIIRPLLKFSKEEILFYAETNNITWREDISNAGNTYKRNLIRNKVLPLLKELNPSLEQTFRQTTEKISDAESVFKAKIEELKKQINKKDKWILTEELLQSENVTPALLAEILKDQGFVYDQAKELFQPHISGTVFETENHQLIKTEKGWELIRKEFSTFTPVKIDALDSVKTIQLLSGLVSFKKYPIENFRIKKDKSVISLDFDQLQFPLMVRKWEYGDKLVPFGMKGMKKISDLLIDAKVPLHEKKNVFVITDAEESILGVINFRGDNRYKISNSTTSVLEITYTST